MDFNPELIRGPLRYDVTLTKQPILHWSLTSDWKLKDTFLLLFLPVTQRFDIPIHTKMNSETCTHRCKCIGTNSKVRWWWNSEGIIYPKSPKKKVSNRGNESVSVKVINISTKFKTRVKENRSFRGKIYDRLGHWVFESLYQITGPESTT